MWTIRFLNGPRAGESVELKARQIVGRDESCEICISDSGVSKRHAEILVEVGQITVKDLRSSNGTYVNGHRIQVADLNIGDKVSFYDVLVEFGISQKSINAPVVFRKNGIAIGDHHGVQIAKGIGANSVANLSYQREESAEIEQEQLPNSPISRQFNSPDKIVERASEFIDKKVMPNVFSMTEHLSFKTVFFSVMVLFLLTVTVLSIIPLYIVTSESIQSESFLRALSVARSVAQINEGRLRSGDLQKFSTEMLYQEKGVEDIYVIGRDGIVLAPMELSGTSPKHVDFARSARGQPREFVTERLGMVLAAVPIISFDPEQQINVAKAHVVVSYSPTTLAFDDSRVFSLFIQVLLIGIIVGGFLFYVLYKLIEYSFSQLYTKLDEAIRSGADQISVNFNFPIVMDLLTIINSLLVRAQSASQSESTQHVTRLNEYISLCNMIPYPSLIIRSDFIIQYINSAFGQMINMTEIQLQNRSVNEIPDSALQQNLTYLIEQANLNPSRTVSDSLEMGGVAFSISCQAVKMESDQVDNFVISIAPQGGET